MAKTKDKKTPTKGLSASASAEKTSRLTSGTVAKTAKASAKGATGRVETVSQPKRPVSGSAKDLAYYLALPYHLTVWQDATDEGTYWASKVQELPGCLGDGETPAEAIESLKTSMALWLSVALKKGTPIPEPAPEDGYSGKFALRMPRSLHRALDQRADREGASLNGWINCVLAQYGT